MIITTTTIFDIKVMSKGGQSNNSSIKVNNAEAPNSAGLNVFIIFTSHSNVLTQSYSSISTQEGMNDFVKTIESLPHGTIVVLSVNGDIAAYLSDRVRTAFSTLGSALIYNVEAGDSWALIGQKGAAPGIVKEGYSKTDVVTLQTKITDAPPTPQSVWIKATAFSESGKQPLLYMGNYNINVPNFNFGQGLNVVALSKTDGSVLSGIHIDFNHLISTQESTDFLTYLKTQEGNIIVFMSMGNVPMNIPEPLLEYCTLYYGCTQMGLLNTGAAWSFIGMYRDLVKSPSEAFASNGTAVCHKRYTIGTVNDFKFTVVGHSTAPSIGSFSEVSVGDFPVLDTTEVLDGLNAVAIDPASGLVFRKTNDTSNIFPFIENIPSGYIVAVVSKNVTTVSTNWKTPRALQTMQSIGAATFGNFQNGEAYVLIGRKGSAPGSVPEMLSSQTSISLAMDFSLEVDVCKPLMQASAYSDIGRGVTNLSVNNKTITFPRARTTGLNCVKFDQVGHILSAASYDMLSDTDKNNLVNLINNTEPDTHFGIVPEGQYAVPLIPQNLKNALNSLGANQFDKPGWSFIGRKGAAVGTVTEASTTDKAAECRAWITHKPEPQKGYKLIAKSGNNPSVFKDGTWVAFNYLPGFNILTFNSTDGSLAETANFQILRSDDISQQLVMAQFIENLPPARIVVIVTKGNLIAPFERCLRAFRTLGSELCIQVGINAVSNWVLIGHKGAAIGSILERAQSTAIDDLCIGTWLPYFKIDDGTQSPRFVGIVIAAVVVIGGVFIHYLSSRATVDEPHAAQQFQKPIPNRRRAVFVGIDYKNIAGLELPDNFGRNIVYSLRERMIETGYFAEEETLFLNEKNGSDRYTSSKKNVLAALDWLVKDAQDGDVLYFHYFGHGNRDTNKNPVENVMVTLNDTLKQRDVLYASEFQNKIKNLPPKVNLTCVIHCCFGGGIIDSSSNGRGIVIASVDEYKPSVIKGNSNLTNLISVRLGTNKKINREDTYQSLFDYIKTEIMFDSPVLRANQTLYNVSTLNFLCPFP